MDVPNLKEVLKGADAVIHSAALHAPHVGICAESEFHRINVLATQQLAEMAKACGIRKFIFTSTTAVYGQTLTNGAASWVTPDTLPKPRTIYHTTKLEAERILRTLSNNQFQVIVLRMSRSFPEPADVMTWQRLTRGIDIRDVASAHLAALLCTGENFQTHLISGITPFTREDCIQLGTDAPAVFKLRVPGLVEEFEKRGWSLPLSVDRVYDASASIKRLNWAPIFGFEEVLAQLERGSLEVLPVREVSIGQRRT